MWMWVYILRLRCCLERVLILGQTSHRRCHAVPKASSKIRVLFFFPDEFKDLIKMNKSKDPKSSWTYDQGASGDIEYDGLLDLLWLASKAKILFGQRLFEYTTPQCCDERRKECWLRLYMRARVRSTRRGNLREEFTGCFGVFRSRRDKTRIDDRILGKG